MTDVLPRFAAALADRYRLERELGAGDRRFIMLQTQTAEGYQGDGLVLVQSWLAELKAKVGK